MSLCIFFGHGECYGLDKGILRTAIEELINQGVNEFMVGNHGGYDGMVFSCLRELSKEFPGLSYSVILAYLPTHLQYLVEISTSLIAAVLVITALYTSLTLGEMPINLLAKRNAKALQLSILETPT